VFQVDEQGIKARRLGDLNDSGIRRKFDPKGLATPGGTVVRQLLVRSSELGEHYYFCAVERTRGSTVDVGKRNGLGTLHNEPAWWRVYRLLGNMDAMVLEACVRNSIGI
jgi:hypothetical protein